MDKPKKCKNCQWYGKPYWSIINPCDNCFNENDYKINIVMRPKGYGKCYKEYKEVIDYYEKEIARLNKIIDEIETIFDTPYFDEKVSKQLGEGGFFTFKQMYEACNIVIKKRLQDLKEEGKE